MSSRSWPREQKRTPSRGDGVGREGVRVQGSPDKSFMVVHVAGVESRAGLCGCYGSGVWH